VTTTTERPPSLDPAAARVDAWLADFESALVARDVDRAAALFATTSFWRDLVSFTWNITTVEGRDGVRDLLQATLASTEPHGFVTTEPPEEADGVTSAWIAFETAVGRGHGHLRLKGEEGAWTLLTTLDELKGHEEPLSERRPMGAEHGANPHRVTWLEARQAEQAELGRTRQPYVVVVGGGQGGIALAARLRQLDVPTIVVDGHPRPGDQWRERRWRCSARPGTELGRTSHRLDTHRAVNVDLPGHRSSAGVSAGERISSFQKASAHTR